ncbi:hypothetical protein INT44_001419 [Umbelopsis vinacea]|uniref:Uncharacterized protein n=1 Tax=Umbelopsis vinacea TaxID=44442 RepID=A0A8H7URW5_9FUNG|nr:hypothetical protein INT44_001419 [Umbelopsis vinacea]
MTQTNNMSSQVPYINVAETARVKLAEHYEYSRTDNSIRRFVLLSNLLRQPPQPSGSVDLPAPLQKKDDQLAQSWFDACLDDLISDDEPTPIHYNPVPIPSHTTMQQEQWDEQQIEDLNEDDEDVPPLCSSASSDDSIWSNDSEDEL